MKYYKGKTFLILLLFSAFMSLVATSQDRCNAMSKACRQKADDIDSKDVTGLTPLMQAAQSSTLKDVQRLLGKGASINLKDEYGWTALTYAIADSRIPIVKALVEHGADLNPRDDRGMTPLMWASIVGNEEIVNSLINRGAEINAAANNGATALSFAFAKERKKIIQLLQGAGGKGAQIDKASLPKCVAPIDQIPELTNFPTPRYTEEARGRGLEGGVNLRVLFGIDGKVKKVRVISELPFGLTEQAISTASKLEAKAAMNKGLPVEYWLRVRIEFNLRR